MAVDSTSKEVFYRYSVSDEWKSLSGHMDHVTIGPLGVFGSSRFEIMYFLNKDLVWQKINGRFKSISSGKDCVAFLFLTSS